jgi:hypothetical protein
MSWVKAGPVDWVSEDAPGYVIVRVGQGYDVLLGRRRIGTRAAFPEAVELVEQDMKPSG